jgi:hypothetical protein
MMLKYSITTIIYFNFLIQELFGRRKLRKKPLKWGIHGERITELLLTGSGGNISHLPCVTEEAKGIN